ncbi:hypothetical protein ABZT06_43400 [Streptomyces sp. NPDC005483]|uniref:hypothetical protein n=1 Tax=Streptomyces sp. NPDC005483 TaxID=3154882 RepID=UPI0033BC078D
MAAGWHRPSEVIGADLLVLTVACGCVAVAARGGGVRAAPGGRRRARTVGTLLVTGPLAAVAVAGLGTGGVLLVGAVSGAVPAWSMPAVAYATGHALAAGAGAATSLVWLGLMRHRIVGTH